MIENWKQKIITIWVGQSISLLTSSVLQMALIWYITEKTGSALMLTCSTIAGFMPHAIFGTFAGVFIDRFSKKHILIFADLFISLASLVLAIVALTANLPVWLIILILFFRSVGTAFHEPTAQAIVPMFVPEKKLASFSGYVQAFDSISQILSPSLAIMLYAIWDLSNIIFLDVLGAIIAIFMILIVKFPKQKIITTKDKPINIVTETKEGLNIIRGNKGILSLIVIGFIYTIIYSPVGSLYPHITMVYFGGSTAQSGFVEIMFSCGSLLGALILGFLGNKLSKALGLIGSIFLYGLGVFFIGTLAPNAYWIFVGISFIVGISIPFYHGITRVIFQIEIEQKYLGRVFAVSQSSRRLAMPIGLLIGGSFADIIGVNVVYMICGILAVFLAVLILNLPSMKNFRKL